LHQEGHELRDDRERRHRREREELDDLPVLAGSQGGGERAARFGLRCGSSWASPGIAHDPSPGQQQKQRHQRERDEAHRPIGVAPTGELDRALRERHDHDRPVPNPAYATPIAVLIRSRNHRLMSIEAGTIPSIDTPSPDISPMTSWNCQSFESVAARRHADPSSSRPSG
jgi:hypothetical protein